MPDKNKLCATLRYLSYGVVCCQSMISAVSGQPITGEAELAGRLFTGALSFTGVFAAGALGNAFYDTYFRPGAQISQNRNLIDVTGEAMSRALEQIVEEHGGEANPGIEKLGEFLDKTKVHWYRLTLEELQPEINRLTTGEIKELLEDPDISTDDNLRVLISELTLARGSGESYLDDETIAFVAGELKTKLPAAFKDVLTDEQSGKPYRTTVLSLLELILQQVAGLQAPPRERSLPSNLPAVRDFIGRGDELAELRESYKNGKRVFLLHGVGGVGKTALALEFAAELKGDYAAHILVDMQGLNRPTLAAEAAMYEVVKQFDPRVPANLGPNDLHNLYVQFLTQHPTLLVLDNADDAPQIEPLNVVDNSCVLVTSRRRFDLAAGDICEVEKMPPPDAGDLLVSIAGAARLGERAGGLAELCGRLPLALRAAASALKKNRLIPTDSYIGKLQDRKERLRLADPTRKNLTVEAAFDLSYELLGADLQTRWRQLAVFPADFGADGAAAVWAAQDGREILNELDGYSLIEVDAEAGRFALHDLARDYTAEKLTPAELAAAQRLHAKHYIGVVAFIEAERKFDYQNALDRLDLEWNNIIAGQKWSAGLAETDAEAAQICSDYSSHVSEFVAMRLHPQEFIEWQTTALGVAQKLGDKHDEATHLGNLGSAYQRLGEYQTAIKFHEQALQIARQLGNKHGEGAHLGNLGNVYLSLGEARKAIEYYEQTLRIARQVGDRLLEATCLGNSGNAYRGLGDYRKAIEYYEQALQMTRQIGDRRGVGNHLANMGNAYFSLSEYRTAGDHHEQALEIFRQIGDRYGEGTSLGNLGNVYLGDGEYRKAIECYERGLEIARQIGDRHGEGTQLSNLGGAYQGLSEYRTAIEFQKQALQIARQIGDRKGEGKRLGSLGVDYLSLGEYRTAIEYCEQALDIARQIGNRAGEVASLNNLGNAYKILGGYRTAIEYYEQALQMARQSGDRQGEGSILGSLGNTYLGLGDYGKTIEYCAQALDIARLVGDRRGTGVNLGNLGNAFLNLGEYRKAIECYEQALQIARQIGDRQGEGIRLGNLGNAYDSLGEYRKAIEFHRQALEIARQIGDRHGEGTHLGNLGRAYQSLEEYLTALEFHDQALRIARQIGDRQGEGNHLGNMGSTCRSLGDNRKAVEYLEQARAMTRQIGDRRGEGTHLGNLGNVYLTVEDYPKAIEYYERALVIARQIGDRYGEGNHLSNMGSAYLNLGETEKACGSWRKALAIYVATESPTAHIVRQWLAEYCRSG